MFELMLDFTDIPTFYSIYITFLLGISLKIIWGWVVEDTFLNSLSNHTKITNYDILDHYLSMPTGNLNHIHSWITKVIRRKDSPNDDGDDHILHLVY